MNKTDILSDKPEFQEFDIEEVRHIHPELAYKEVKTGSAILLDVRETNEVNLECVDMNNVLNCPLSVIMDKIQHIPENKSIYIICNEGFRSVKVANLLNRQGFPHVANVDGGLQMWRHFELPIISRRKDDPCRGCKCSCDQC